jgi:fibrillarin-like pre-rRNA processing protein
VQSTEWAGVFRRGRDLFTENARPGRRVYGEEIVTENGVEYRRWDPWRSKLSAYLVGGARRLPFDRPRSLLYLGAAHGTTVSHLADLVPEASLFAVEKSPRAFATLLGLARERPRLFPLLADAQLPERYAADVGVVDFLYQDVAQRNQAEIFGDNAVSCLRSGGTGLLFLKVRSVTQRRSAGSIVTDARRILEHYGLTTVDQRPLVPYARDHVALTVARSTRPR